MKICPCCGSTLLRHVGRRDLYWFCTACRQEMPVYDSLLSQLPVGHRRSANTTA